MSKDSNTQMEQRQFCQQEGLSEPSFYSWRKRFAKPALLGQNLYLFSADRHALRFQQAVVN